MTWVLCYPGGKGLPAGGHREVARAHHLGCSCTCCSLSGNIVRAGDSGIQPEGPPEATQTLKICFAKRKKRLLTMAASSPHGAASNTIRTLVGHSVRAQFAQLRNEGRKGEGGTCHAKPLPTGHMGGPEPGPRVESRGQNPHGTARPASGRPGHPLSAPVITRPSEPRNPALEGCG